MTKMSGTKLRNIAGLALFLLAFVPSAGRAFGPAQGDPAAAQNAAAALDRIIDAAIEHENALSEVMAKHSPIVETYIQDLKNDKEFGAVPSKDHYFLTKLDAWEERDGHSMTPEAGFLSRLKNGLTKLYSVRYIRMGLVEMIFIDSEGFNRENYRFQFVGKEFLGDVRCNVFDVEPQPDAGKDRFSGRIWIEDEGNNIVRFNGVQGRSGFMKLFFHADSWRQNVAPGLWLPVYVYSEESDLSYVPGLSKVNFKAQTRIWGYNSGGQPQLDEHTSLQVQSDAVKDKVEGDTDGSPVLSLRAWERQAEENVIQRLYRAGLLAPEGEVDNILKTVAGNLEITNDLTIEPPIRARVMLTAPMESFTIGHTIVVSRGLIDVLPDEASLAMVLAHEVAHIALGHKLDTKYAFHDRMLFEDHAAFQELFVKRTKREEAAADEKAIEFLRNSPYKDKLEGAGLFLRAVQRYGKALPELLEPHLGNRFANGSNSVRMNALVNQAPEIDANKIDQIAALPLGGRLRVDPWTGTASLVNSKPVALLGAREKMPFEITPLFPHLVRLAPTEAGPVAIK